MLKKLFLLFTIISASGLLFWVLWSKLVAQNTRGPKPYSNIKLDENVVFFLTSAWLDEGRQVWHIPIHGWIYEPQNSYFRKDAFERVLKEKYDLIVTKDSKALFNRRVNLLISDNERGKEIVIELAGKAFILPESEPNGHIETVLKISVEELLVPKNNRIDFNVLTHEEELRTFSGQVMLLPPKGRSVISDIDDTVKYSYVTDRKKLIEYTFFKEFMAIEGMPELYQSWQQQGIDFHFVSSSPWYLYEPLQEFMVENQFPRATLSLKKFRFRDKSLMNLFKKGTETKPIAIEAILNQYPQRTFILVGDSGEQDPEVYADIAQRYPAQIEKVYIRQVPDANTDFDTIFAAIEADKWAVFDSPSELM